MKLILWVFVQQALHEMNSGTRSASPRSTKSYHESITPPENYHYGPAVAHSRIPAQPGSGHQFALDCYVKNRIVEAMRTEETDKRGDDLPEQQRRTPLERPQPSSSAHHNKDIDRSSTPGDMVIDEESSQARPASRSTGEFHFLSIGILFSKKKKTNPLMHVRCEILQIAKRIGLVHKPMPIRIVH